MLNRLLNVLQTTPYNIKTKAIGNLKNSCCKELDYKIIDFDEVKDIYCKQNKKPSMASCDCLDVSHNRIDFIEMKGFENFKKYNTPLNKEVINNQIGKFDFEKKLKDSNRILNSISNENSIDLTKTKKRYFIATDLNINDNPLETLNMTLIFLSHTSSDDVTIHRILNEKVKNISDNSLAEKPKLVSCCELIKFLQEV